MSTQVTNYDHQAETCTIAACLLSRTARDEARRHVSAKDFHDTRFEEIWNVIARLDRTGVPVDAMSVLIELQTINPAAAALMPELGTVLVAGESVGHYAQVVRSWSLRRTLYREAVTVQQKVMKPDLDTSALAAGIANRFAAIRDSSVPEDAESITLTELLSETDEAPEWVIPGLLERGDRLMLTGEEGLGKSYLLRQIAILAAYGLDPFEPDLHIPEISILIVDCENNRRQVRRKARGVTQFAAKQSRFSTGMPSGSDRVNILCSKRMEITADRDLARVHREIDAVQPDLVIIGPLYRLTDRALTTDDEATPVLAALDTIRDRDIALLIEAHAGHTTSGTAGTRNLRPRGSSALMGWPEFGYGLRKVSHGYADLVPWRGDRDERKWPDRIRHDSDRVRWIPVDAAWDPPTSFDSHRFGA